MHIWNGKIQVKKSRKNWIWEVLGSIWDAVGMVLERIRRLLEPLGSFFGVLRITGSAASAVRPLQFQLTPPGCCLVPVRKETIKASPCNRAENMHVYN